jgi:hypothetical protein
MGRDLGDPRTYAEVTAQLESLDRDGLGEVLGDLVPQGGRKKPLLADSRDVTVYAQALHHPEAYRALREYHDLELARQIVEEAGLPERIVSDRHALEVMITEVTRARALGQAVLEATVDLVNVANSLEAIARSKIRGD